MVMVRDYHNEDNKMKGVAKMIELLHPVSGEKGYFCTEQEKVLIDAIISDYSNRFVFDASRSARGGSDE